MNAAQMRRLFVVVVISSVTTVATVLFLREPPASKATADVQHFGLAWRETDIREVIDGFELMTPEKTWRAVDDPARYLVRLIGLTAADPDDHWLLECVRQDGRLIAHGQCYILAKDGSELHREYDHGEWVK